VPKRLTPSAYAVLGLLSLRPWSGYDLAQQAKRSLRFAWPKSEAHLYAEPKKLVELGLAARRTQQAGRRTRSVYSITRAGRRALREWLRTEPQPLNIEAEPLVRLLFADQGDLDDLRLALDALARNVDDLHGQGMAILEDYRAGKAPFPDRLHLSVLYASLQADLYLLISAWARFAQREIDAWPTTRGLGLTPRTAQLLDQVLARRSVLDLRPPGASAG
jgi:DNA-binding PadR family transcriptional regulator